MKGVRFMYVRFAKRFLLSALHVNEAKSQLMPSQQIILLGFVVNSVSMTCYFQLERLTTVVDNVTHACRYFLNNLSPSIRDVAHVTGFLEANK